MKYITAKQAAQQWDVTPRQVQELCRQGRIPGAQRWERNWMIPADALYPMRKTHSHARYHLPMPRRSPFLDLTDLYDSPGGAQARIASLADQPEAQELFAASIAYSQGNVEAVYAHAQSILGNRTGFYSTLAGGMLLSMCAVWRGDEDLWKKAKIHLCEAPCRNEVERSIVEMSLAAADLAIRDTRNFPEWFKQGRFEYLPADAHPAAKLYYIRYLMIRAQELAQEQHLAKGSQSLASIHVLPHLLEPFIAQAMVDKTVLVEICMRLLCAIAYQNDGDIPNATLHIDRAIALALPDMLVAPMVELRRQLGYLLDDRLALANPEALKLVKALQKEHYAGWAKLHNSVLNRSVSTTLSVREREVARLASFGLTDAQIAEQLNLSVATIKSTISMAKNKTGATKRGELGAFI